MRRSIAMGLVLVAALGVWACGGPEERKAKYRVRAQEYFQQGNYPKARVALRNVLQIDPKDAEAYFLYAQVEEKERNWRNAFAGYQQVVELNPEHDLAQIKLAKYYLEARALEQAGQITDRLLAKQPEHVPAKALKIALTAVSGRLNDAVPQAEQLVAAAPAEIDAVLLIASLYTSTQRPGDAVPYLRRALDANPANLELLDAMATTLTKQGQMAEAEATLARIVQLEPAVLTHRLRQVALFDQRQQYQKAEAVLQDAVRADPDNDQRRLALVEYVAKRRGVEPAEAALQQAKKELPRAGKLWFALGSLYESTRRADQARDLYHEMLIAFTGKPEAAEARVKLAALDWAAGNTDDAAQQVEAVLKDSPRSSEALLLRGKMALQRANGKDAILDFRSVLKDQPEFADAHVLLARAHLLTGEPALARESLDRAIAFKPSLVEAQVLLADLDAAAGQFKEARQRLDALLARDPGNVPLLSRTLQLQLQEKDWGKSQDTLAQLRRAGIDEAAADLAEGHVATAQQQWDAAEAAYRKAFDRRPTAAEPLLALVQLDMRRGKLAQAQERLEGVLAKMPDHLYAAGFLGEILLTKGDAPSAAVQFDRAARVNPKWTTPWVHLARIRYAEKRATDGDNALLKGLEASPDNEQLRLLLALSLTAQHRHDDAIGQYETVLKYAPTSLLAANNLAAALVDYKGDPRSLERALALSRGFESQQPNPYLLDTLGWAHHKLGHATDALRVLQQATALAPEHPVLNYHLGAAFAKAGQRTEAATHLKKAIAAGTPFDGLDEAKTLLGEVAG